MERLDQNPTTFLKALVYGNTGTGKTTLGVTAPKPVILLSERQGAFHIQQAAKRLGVPVPPTFFLQTMNDYRNWLRALQGDRSKPLRVTERLKNPKDNSISERLIVELEEWPETVVLDSLTDVGRLLVEEIRRESPPKRGQDGLPVDSQRFWQTLGDRFKSLVWAFRDLPMNTLFLALSEDREDGEEGLKIRVVTADLPMRKLAKTVAAAVNLVAYSFRREVREGTAPTKIQYGVMVQGPEHVTLKPCHPLRPTEVPNFALWVRMVRDSVEVLPPAPAPSQESMQASDLQQEPAPEPQPEPETEPEPQPEPDAEPETQPEEQEEVENA